MKYRNYIVKHTEQEGEPIIARGQAPFYANDDELIPAGYRLDVVQNQPDLKTLYVLIEKK